MYNNNALSEMHITHTRQAAVQFSLAYPYRLTVKKQRDTLYIHRASSFVSAAMVRSAIIIFMHIGWKTQSHLPKSGFHSTHVHIISLSVIKSYLYISYYILPLYELPKSHPRFSVTHALQWLSSFQPSHKSPQTSKTARTCKYYKITFYNY